MRKYLLITIILSTLTLMITGCCEPNNQRCWKAWYGLEPDPRQPERYRFTLQGWIEEIYIEVFGPPELQIENYQRRVYSSNPHATNFDFASNRESFNRIAERIKNIEVE